MNEVLSGLTFAFGYLDDILVFSPDMETHLKHLRSLFEKLREANLKLKEVKSNFFKKHIQYLGHIISGEGITPVPEKLESIQNILPPKTLKEVKQFLGLNLKLKEVKSNFFKKHIQYLGHIISGEGITPVPEKLESIQNILPPKTLKEVKQFLGLIGYY